jgi:hypothetical protein
VKYPGLDGKQDLCRYCNWLQSITHFVNLRVLNPVLNTLCYNPYVCFNKGTNCIKIYKTFIFSALLLEDNCILIV